MSERLSLDEAAGRIVRALETPSRKPGELRLVAHWEAILSVAPFVPWPALRLRHRRSFPELVRAYSDGIARLVSLDAARRLRESSPAAGFRGVALTPAVLAGEVLPPESDQPSTITLTNEEAWALWDWTQDDASVNYWEHHGLSSLAGRLKEWIRTEAPW